MIVMEKHQYTVPITDMTDIKITSDIAVGSPGYLEEEPFE